MDVETLAAAKKVVLPNATAGDAGAVMVVDNEGKWSKGEVVTATITVDGTKLKVITSE